jgi:hypothetical protein
LDRALATSQKSNSLAGLLDGVKLIRSQFDTALSELGLEEIPVKGEPFNPEIAEAVETVEVDNEAQDNLVLEVVSRGYRINETLVRPAQVKVGIIKSPVPSQQEDYKRMNTGKAVKRKIGAQTLRSSIQKQILFPPFRLAAREAKSAIKDHHLTENSSSRAATPLAVTIKVWSGSCMSPG